MQVDRFSVPSFALESQKKCTPLSLPSKSRKLSYLQVTLIPYSLGCCQLWGNICWITEAQSVPSSRCRPWVLSSRMVFPYISKSLSMETDTSVGRSLLWGHWLPPEGNSLRSQLGSVHLMVSALEVGWGTGDKVPEFNNTDLPLLVFSTWDFQVRHFPVFPVNKLCDFTGRLHRVREGPGDSAALDPLLQWFPLLLALFFTKPLTALSPGG